MNSKFPLSRPLEPGETIDRTDLYARDDGAGNFEQVGLSGYCGSKVGAHAGVTFRRPVAPPLKIVDSEFPPEVNAAERTHCGFFKGNAWRFAGVASRALADDLSADLETVQKENDRYSDRLDELAAENFSLKVWLTVALIAFAISILFYVL